MTNYNRLLRSVLLFAIPVIFLSCRPQEAREQASTPLNTPEWAYDATIYEVNIRQFSEEGTFQAFAEHLPRLKEMGVKILWLMPIHPIGEVERKGGLGSYYSVKDYFDVNPEFGTKEDFRDLVGQIHDHGMYIILDWVANHTAWDNELTVTNPEFYEVDSEGSFIPPRGTDWDDVIQLDYSNPDVHDYMAGALSYWVEEFNIDGYRCDVADLVPTEFWNRARRDLDQIKPVFMLAEAETPEHHEAAFEMSYAWAGHHMMNSIAQGTATPAQFDSLLDADRQRFPDHAFRMHMTSNHDENSWNGTVFERLGDAAMTMAVLASTVEGMPLVYNGQEVGLDHRLEFFEKDEINWDFDSPFHDLYTRLLHLNRDNRALWNGHKGSVREKLPTSNDDAAYVFVREKDGDKVLVVLNLTDDRIDISIDNDKLEGSYTELFSDVTVDFNTQENFDLEPWAYRVFVK